MFAIHVCFKQMPAEVLLEEAGVRRKMIEWLMKQVHQCPRSNSVNVLLEEFKFCDLLKSNILVSIPRSTCKFNRNNSLVVLFSSLPLLKKASSSPGSVG